MPGAAAVHHGTAAGIGQPVRDGDMPEKAECEQEKAGNTPHTDGGAKAGARGWRTVAAPAHAQDCRFASMRTELKSRSAIVRAA